MVPAPVSVDAAATAAAAAAAADVDPKKRCNYPGCIFVNAPLDECQANEGCTQMLHHMCQTDMEDKAWKSSNKYNEEEMNNPYESKVMKCCLTCHEHLGNNSSTAADVPTNPPPHKSTAPTKPPPKSKTNGTASVAHRSAASANAPDVLAACAPLHSIFKASHKKKKAGTATIDLTADEEPAKKKQKKQKKQMHLKAPSNNNKKTPSSKNIKKQSRKEARTFSNNNFKKEVLEYADLNGTDSALSKYKISKQSLSQWKQKRDIINHMVETTHSGGEKKRIRIKDGLRRIRLGILAFYDLNQTMPKDLQINITGK